ncbi:hypothetical protein [Actinopolyspora halophila]|uniref:hypothetical protein n=1 Tax=Actinopolyspora halophila TaxID=1850 RepID=UPI0012FA216A|nr:hypothetical protein [Actinopolyspora halophila]
MGGRELLLLLFLLAIPGTVLALVARGKRRGRRLSNGPQQAHPHDPPGYCHPGYYASRTASYQQLAQQWQQAYWQARHLNGPYPPARLY